MVFSGSLDFFSDAFFNSAVQKATPGSKRYVSLLASLAEESLGSCLVKKDLGNRQKISKLRERAESLDEIGGAVFLWPWGTKRSGKQFPP